MLQQSTLDFLKKLRKNNNKEWFDKNKKAYEVAREDFLAYVQKLIAGVSSFEPSAKELDPKKCVFRIYRDVRFSKDKTPYKTHFGAHITRGGVKTSGTGYYVHIEPGNSFLAGGWWMPESPELNAIRQEIDYNQEEFKNMLKDKAFVRYFKKLDEEHKLKTIPKGYDKNHPFIELLKLKSFTVTSELKDETVTGKDFVKHSISVFKAVKPLNDFLARAID
jgi:uncharacterized protein (TIGR02453 family)